MPPQAGDIFLNRCSLTSSIKKTGNYSQPNPKESPLPDSLERQTAQIQRQDIQARNDCHITQQDARTTGVKTQHPGDNSQPLEEEAVLWY